MPKKIVIDKHGRKKEETFEYTQDELDAQEVARLAAEAEAAAGVSKKAELAANLQDLLPHENAAPILRGKINTILEQIRILRGV